MNEGICIYGLPHCLRPRVYRPCKFEIIGASNVRVAPGEFCSFLCQHSLELSPSLGPCPLKSLMRPP